MQLMSLLVGLWSSIGLSVINSFMWGLWGLGLNSLVSSLFVFGNIGVECLSESFWKNSISSVLVLMSLWVGGACYLGTGLLNLESVSEFGICVLVLAVLSGMLFMVANWFVLFFLFESSLLPIGMLILGWGYQPERLQAAGYMVMYTVCASLPLLVAFVWIFAEGGSMSFFGDCELKVWNEFLLLVLLGAFLVKSPVFMAHMWLPKAHVEAPVAGSMMLAGVLLKFGGYGCVLVYYFYMPASWGVTCFLMSFIVLGGLACGFMCFRQTDMKSLIAYSSIGHMALCLAGFMTCYTVGWVGGLVLMVAHGMCSPGMFALSGYTYNLFSSRSLFLCKGVLSLAPSLSLVWFLFCSGNMAFPPSVGLLGEIMLMFSLVSFNVWFMVPLAFMVFVAGIYSLILYSLIQHGRVSDLTSGGSVLWSGYMTMSWILWIPLNLLMGFSDVMSGSF